MIARVWRCRGPRETATAAAEHILSTGVAECTGLPGYLGAQLLRRDRDTGPAYFTLVTFWRDEESIRGFAGDDVSRAVLYPGDARHGLESDGFVTHHVVLHADLAPTGGGSTG